MQPKRRGILRALIVGLVLSTSLSAIPIESSPRPAAPSQLDSLSPTMGPIGTQVTVYGSGFTPEDNLVLFDGFGVIPHLASKDGTTITFTVPDYLDPYCLYIAPRCGHPQVMVVQKRYEITVQNTQGVSGTLSFTVTGALYMPLVIR